MSDSHHAAPPSLPEPRTPMWLPAVGAALFSLAGLGWALTPTTPPPADEAVAATATAPAPTPAPTVAAPRQPGTGLTPAERAHARLVPPGAIPSGSAHSRQRPPPPQGH